MSTRITSAPSRTVPACCSHPRHIRSASANTPLRTLPVTSGRFPSPLPTSLQKCGVRGAHDSATSASPEGSLSFVVQEMALHEVGIVIDYFHDATPEHLELLGVDPTRLPSPSAWRERYAREYAKPIEQRATLLVIWKSGDQPVGFSSADKIVFGKQANMHLHVLRPEDRNSGFGTACVAQTAQLYF